MPQEEFINKNYYFWFWTFVKPYIKWEIILSNQTVFQNKVFEILWHGESVQSLKDDRGDAFDGTKQKIYYFDMIERAYKMNTPHWAQWVIKYEILKIIE